MFKLEDHVTINFDSHTGRYGGRWRIDKQYFVMGEHAGWHCAPLEGQSPFYGYFPDQYLTLVERPKPNGIRTITVILKYKY